MTNESTEHDDDYFTVIGRHLSRLKIRAVLISPRRGKLKTHLGRRLPEINVTSEGKQAIGPAGPVGAREGRQFFNYPRSRS